MNDRTKHLDLGCGIRPRNPFNADELYGVDIIDPSEVHQTFIYAKCNLSIERLPFPDDYFDSVSAYDFFEHIPRVYIENGITTFPFVEVMSDVYRVLKPSGKLHALTPVYPKESAFVDPTHVNFITKNAYKYFINPHCWAKMYGFTGAFDKIQVRIVNFEMVEKRFSFLKHMALTIFNILYPRRKQHILWYFKANKNGLL